VSVRVVVVGATGNVGTSVVEQLAIDGGVESVVGIARRRPAWHPDKVEWVEADVAKDDLGPFFVGADAVIHLAWAFQPSHRPAVTWNVNVIGTARLLRMIESAGVPALVVASSVAAYSPGDKSRRVDEDWPTHGWSPAAYCREKAYVERLLDHFEAVHPSTRVVRMRPCFLFQPAAAPEQRRIFAGPLLPERLVGRFGVPIVPDLPGLQLQALHTEDAARAYVQAIHADVSGAFNLAADPIIDAAAISEVFGGRTLRLPVRPVRELLAAAWHSRAVPAPPELFDYVLQMPLMDCSRAHGALGWRPRNSAIDALAGLRAGLRGGAGISTPPLAS